MFRKIVDIFKSILFYIMGLLFLFPIIWIGSVSIRAKKDVFDVMFFSKDMEIHLENYVEAWQTFGFSRLFLNSSIVTLVSIAVTIVVGAFAGYGFAKLKYRGSNIVFIVILSGIMIPPAGIVIPYFLLMNFMGLYNTLFALIFSYIAFGLPISMLIFSGFFQSIPDELLEAARIDGYSEIGIFSKILVPLSKPAFATVIILLVVSNWNEFLIALILLRDEVLYTLPLGVAKYVGEYDSPWHLIAAGVIIAALPMVTVYLFMQRQFIKGLTEGATKG